MECNRKAKGYVHGFDVGAVGSRGGVSMFWRNDIKAEVISYSNWHVDIKVEDSNTGGYFYMTGFYGCPVASDRRNSWGLIRNIAAKHTEQLPWIVGGDFNEILRVDEKQGGRVRDERQMQDFRDVLAECLLEDAGYSGSWYTWERGLFVHNNVRERLDRMVVSEDWWESYPNSQVSHLPFYHSDHRPILLSGMQQRRDVNEFEGGSKQFRFEASWVMEEGFEPMLRNLWDSTSGSLFEKLNSIGVGLEQWGKTLDTDRVEKQKLLEEELERLNALPLLDEVMFDTIQNKLELN